MDLRSRSRCLLVVWTLPALAGCATYPRVPCPPRVTPALGEMRSGHAVVQLLFATDRRPTGADEPALMFGIERARGLTYGRSEVSIPAQHAAGRVDEALFAAHDPSRNVVLLSAQTLDRPGRGQVPQQFLDELRTRVDRSPRREVFVFVHGYAATFESAARTAAQVAHDIRFDGVPIVYTWPTQGSVLSYLVDGANAEWTVPYFVDFLELLVHEAHAEHIHLMAHSMGTRVLANGLRDYMARQGRMPHLHPTAADAEPDFDQIIFAAADLDAEIFERDYVPFVLTAARRATVYVSTNDWALGLSVRLNGYFRLGQGDLPNVDLEALQRIDVVDVTAFDRDFLGHFYFSQCPRVLEDLAGVLDTPAAPRAAPPATAENDKTGRRLQRTFYYRMNP